MKLRGSERIYLISSNEYVKVWIEKMDHDSRIDEPFVFVIDPFDKTKSDQVAVNQEYFDLIVKHNRWIEVKQP